MKKFLKIFKACLKIIETLLTIVVVGISIIIVTQREKFLKRFDKNCSFYLSGDMSPVYIYEGYVLAGVILPIARKRG